MFRIIKKILVPVLGVAVLCGSLSAKEKPKGFWGEGEGQTIESGKDTQWYSDAKFAMFIHWGLYSGPGGIWEGEHYYGISEWLMNRAKISVADYEKLATNFNPTEYDANEIAKLAADAGMKYIVITAKHHDGFAMYDSKACDFNITDMTPWGVDPMKELSAACRDAGLGFGFYYSHNQDWTFPGGNGGPKVDEDGNAANFDDYFTKKCLPQVEELTTEYGPIEIIWFDTPGRMAKEYVEQLVNVVRKNQPKALVSGRAGHNLGDYQTLGDMEVPHRNVEGMWESVDTTNDSWAYAWYDENWKTPEKVLHRLVACVARGGTYMLNIGPDGLGAVPERAAWALREAGSWIQRYPQVVYNAGSSPWGHAFPWGDVTVRGNKLSLSVFDWPSSGKLFVPGLKTRIKSVRLLGGKKSKSIGFDNVRGWTVLNLPAVAPDSLASVIEIELAGEAVVDTTFGLDPNGSTEIFADFGEVDGVEIINDRWMEKFGEWIRVHPASNWETEGKVVWEVEVLEPGDYQVSLNYAGSGRLVWGVEVVGGESIQNQQNSSHNYQEFPIGWLNFPTPGKYKVAVSCLEGEIETAKLKSISLKPVVAH